MIDCKLLLRAVLSFPAGDLPRLVLADSLAARHHPGDLERSEFIRVQCQLAVIADFDRSERNAKLGHQPIANQERERLGRRERELWEAGRLQWCGLISETFPQDGSPVLWTRGFVSLVRLPLTKFVGLGACRACSGRGTVTTSGESDASGRFSSALSCCSTCSGSGRNAGYARAIFQEHPITDVVLTNAAPYVVSRTIRRSSIPDANEATDLPSELFDHVTRHPLATVVRSGQAVTFPHPHTTQSAVSAACVAWGRSLAGLPAFLPPPTA